MSISCERRGYDAGARSGGDWHGACTQRNWLVDHHCFSGGCDMAWTKPEFEVVELGMEVGAYAGNA
jgi:coenzyme PQQ precursor peptide PqqA